MNKLKIVKWGSLCIWAVIFYFFYMFFKDRTLDLTYIFYYFVFLIGSLGLFILFDETSPKKKSEVKSNE